MAVPSERLPWLHDEPPARAAPAAQKKRGGSMWPWYLLLLLLIAGVAAGAWWLSTAEEAAPPELPAEESLPIPVTPPAPVEADADEPPVSAAAPAPEAPQRAPARTTVRPEFRSAEPRNGVTPAPGSQDTDEVGRSIFPADEPAPAPPAILPNSVAVANARPYRGRVVQLGAFPTRAKAEESWQRVTRRYPYLATKPKMVNTVDVRALGGGRPTRMYRLQLGTSSQAQSVVICQQLERAGHSCVVVY